MKTEIFKSYGDFLSREDKTINGVSNIELAELPETSMQYIADLEQQNAELMVGNETLKRAIGKLLGDETTYRLTETGARSILDWVRDELMRGFPDSREADKGK